MTKTSVAIIGAGMCGLSIGAQLQADAIEHLIIEKSRGVGGRMATRRDGEAVYDHGAAFYADTDAEPLLWHSRWSAHQQSKLWFSEGSRRHVCGRNGMTALAKDLAQDQKIILGEKITRLQMTSTGVLLQSESERVFEAEKIVLTSPLPQSLDLLKTSGLAYPDVLNLIRYNQALVGLFEIQKTVDLFDFQFLRPEDSTIFTIANNQAKGISTSLALTVVMSSAWSEFHFSDEEPEVLRRIEAELKRVLATDVQVLKSQLKKWRYSQPVSHFKDLCMTLYNGQIILAGDAFGGGSIAGAVRSAMATYDSLKNIS